MSYKSRKVAGALASVAVGVGLLGGGVYATLADSVAATDSVNVANGVACSLSTTDTNAVVNGNSITIAVPEIQAYAGNYLHNVKVTNSGSSTILVNWTATPHITMPSGSGYIDNTLTTSNPSMANNVIIASGANQNYTDVGVVWGSMQNEDKGATAQVVYTAHCNEAPASKVQFIGYASQTGHAALTLPSGAQPGDIALVLEGGGSSTIATPSGYSVIAQPVAPRQNMSYRMIVAGDTAVPAAATAVTDMSVAVYRNATLGARTYNSGNTNNVGLQAGSPLYSPAHCTAESLSNTGGSSWVACMGYDNYATTNMNQLSFNKIASGPPTPYVADGVAASNRSAGGADIHMGLADTGGGVSAWTESIWSTPGDNFPLPGTHGIGVQTIELISAP